MAIHPCAYIGSFGDFWAVVFAHNHSRTLGVAIRLVIAYVVTRTNQCALVLIGAISTRLAEQLAEQRTQSTRRNRDHSYIASSFAGV